MSSSKRMSWTRAAFAGICALVFLAVSLAASTPAGAQALKAGDRSKLVAVSITTVNPVQSEPFFLFLEKSQQFIATGTYADGSTQDLTTAATWTSSNVIVAVVSDGGLVYTNIIPGDTTISASVMVHGHKVVTASVPLQVGICIVTPPIFIMVCY